MSSAASDALTALVRYLDIREQFHDCDEEGRSGVYWHELDEARVQAVEALAHLAVASAQPNPAAGVVERSE